VWFFFRSEGRSDFDKSGLWLVDSDEDIMNFLDWTVIMFYFVGMVFLIPLFRELQLVSVYEYLGCIGCGGTYLGF
jgi:hypothetical protein